MDLSIVLSVGIFRAHQMEDAIFWNVRITAIHSYMWEYVGEKRPNIREDSVEK